MDGVVWETEGGQKEPMKFIPPSNGPGVLLLLLLLLLPPPRLANEGKL